MLIYTLFACLDANDEMLTMMMLMNDRIGMSVCVAANMTKSALRFRESNVAKKSPIIKQAYMKSFLIVCVIKLYRN